MNSKPSTTIYDGPITPTHPRSAETDLLPITPTRSRSAETDLFPVAMTTTATASRRVLLLHGDPNEASRLNEVLTKAGFAVEVTSEPNPAPADLFDRPPSMVLVAEGTGGRPVETRAHDLKADP